MKIVFVRHGKPDLAAWPNVRSGKLGEWIGAYARSAISAALPPEEALQAGQECRVIVTSDLPRSIGSAAALHATAPTVSEDLFREATWPFTSFPLLRLKPYSWAALFRIAWFLGYRKNCEEPVNAVKKRAEQAADRLVSLAQTYDSVLLVGHGIFNTFIVRVLLKRGWKGPLLPGYRYWAVTRYSK